MRSRSNIKRNAWQWSFGLLLLSCLVTSAKAETADQQPTNDPWRFGSFQAGFALSMGVDTGRGIEPGHDLVLGIIHCGWVVTDPVATNSWLKGNLELGIEAFGGEQYNPHNCYLFGGTLVVRYNFLVDEHWVPFFEIGAGPSYTNIGPPDLSTKFQFNDQIGVGCHWFFCKDLAVTVGYRVAHFSNGGIKEPNHGVNNHLFRVGLTRLF